jgi:RNA polymerase sigma-70 factor (ECF subfamily)
MTDSPASTTTDVWSDEALARHVQAGNADAFGVLVERYEAKLMRYGTKFLSSRDDITDLVQDAFIRAYQNIQSFDASLRFSPWMYRIAHNEFVSALRKRSRTPVVAVDFDALIAHPAYDDPAPREREQKEMRVLIDKGLEQISPKYREVLVLYFLEELSYKEIADVLQVPVSTVGIRLKRGKEALKAIYKDSKEVYG